jgi:hypothetical protein
MLSRNKLSHKINYEVLQGLFDTTADGDGTRGQREELSGASSP